MIVKKFHELSVKESEVFEDINTLRKIVTSLRQLYLEAKAHEQNELRATLEGDTRAIEYVISNMVRRLYNEKERFLEKVGK